MYERYKGATQHCPYYDHGRIEADRAYYLSYWEKGEGVSFDDHYGYMAEE